LTISLRETDIHAFDIRSRITIVFPINFNLTVTGVVALREIAANKVRWAVPKPEPAK